MKWSLVSRDSDERRRRAEGRKEAAVKSNFQTFFGRSHEARRGKRLFMTGNGAVTMGSEAVSIFIFWHFLGPRWRSPAIVVF